MSSPEKPRTCLPCRQSKTRCNKRIPCDRCLRLDLICQPQTRSRGRPLKLHKTRSEILAEQMHQQGGDGEDMALVSKPSSLQAAPGVAWPPPNLSGEGAFRVSNEAFALGIYMLKVRGLLHSARLAAITKTWAAENYRRGMDISRGLIKYMVDLVGQGQQPDVSIGPLDPNATAAELERVRACPQQPSLPSFVERLDDGVSAYCGYYFYRGEFVHFANEAFSRLYMCEEEINQRFRELAVIPSVVWSRALAPEDQSEFYTSMISYTFSPPGKGKEMSMLVHSIDRQGHRRLCLARVRYVLLLGGAFASLVLSLTPMPGQLSHSGQASQGPPRPSPTLAALPPPPPQPSSSQPSVETSIIKPCMSPPARQQPQFPQVDPWAVLERPQEVPVRGGPQQRAAPPPPGHQQQQQEEQQQGAGGDRISMMTPVEAFFEVVRDPSSQQQQQQQQQQGCMADQRRMVGTGSPLSLTARVKFAPPPPFAYPPHPPPQQQSHSAPGGPGPSFSSYSPSYRSSDSSAGGGGPPRFGQNVSCPPAVGRFGAGAVGSGVFQQIDFSARLTQQQHQEPLYTAPSGLGSGGGGGALSVASAEQGEVGTMGPHAGGQGAMQQLARQTGGLGQAWGGLSRPGSAMDSAWLDEVFPPEAD